MVPTTPEVQNSAPRSPEETVRSLRFYLERCRDKARKALELLVEKHAARLGKSQDERQVTHALDEMRTYLLGAFQFAEAVVLNGVRIPGIPENVPAKSEDIQHSLTRLEGFDVGVGKPSETILVDIAHLCAEFEAKIRVRFEALDAFEQKLKAKQSPPKKDGAPKAKPSAAPRQKTSGNGPVASSGDSGKLVAVSPSDTGNLTAAAAAEAEEDPADADFEVDESVLAGGAGNGDGEEDFDWQEVLKPDETPKAATPGKTPVKPTGKK